jgi:hypothetical protein
MQQHETAVLQQRIGRQHPLSSHPTRGEPTDEPRHWRPFRRSGRPDRPQYAFDFLFYQLLDPGGVTDDVHLFNEQLREWVHQRVLICDRDAKWSAPVRARLGEAGIRVVQTPFQAPNANAYAERFVRSIKQECLNCVIPLGECHLRRTMAEFVEHYHQEPESPRARERTHCWGRVAG